MTVTLDWLIARPGLNLRLLTCTDDGARVIRWVHAIELADPTPWLTGGEMVLTTGLRLPSTTRGQAEYVDRLAASDAAALGFGIGVEHDLVPRTVVDRCARAGLPLVEVPLPTPFVAITQVVADAYAAQQQESVQRALTLQQQMTSSALADGVPGVARGLAHALHSEVVVLDHHLAEVCCEAVDPLVLMDLVRAELVRAELARAEPGGRATPGPPSSINVVDGDGALTVQSLGSRESSRGWLGVRSAASLHPTDRLLVNQAASLITLQLERRPDVTRFERQVGAFVLRQLLRTAAADPQAPALVQRLGLVSDSGLVVLAVHASTHSGTSAGDPPGEQASDALDDLHVPHLSAVVGEGADQTLFLMVGAVHADTAATAIGTALSRLGRHELSIGLSAAVADGQIFDAGQQALRAVRAAHWQRRRLVRFGDLQLDAIIDDPQIGARLGALTAPALQPLQELGEPAAAQLTAALEAFLQHNGSWEAASRALGVHRHTLRTRIERVEQVTGLRLGAAQDRMVALIALLHRSRDRSCDRAPL